MNDLTNDWQSVLSSVKPQTTRKTYRASFYTAVKRIKKEKRQNKKYQNKKWIDENLSFLLRSFCSVEKDSFSIKKNARGVIESLLDTDKLLPSTENMRFVFEKISLMPQIEEKDLRMIRDAFIISLALRISQALDHATESIPRWIGMMHQIQKIPFDSLIRSYSPIERLLRRDPAGIYPAMTRQTQGRYRAELKRRAKKSKKSELFLTKEILSKATEKGVHVGEYLKEKKLYRPFYPLVFLLFSLLIWEFYQVTDSGVMSFFMALPLYFFCHGLCQFVFSVLYTERPLYQMRVDRVDNDHKTSVVITSLIQKKSDIDLLGSKLRRYAVNNRSDGDEMYFGLLLDLPEHREKAAAEDEDIIAYLSEKVEEWNEGENVFFALLRDRSYHESEGRYFGRERKRGAIETMIHYLETETALEEFYLFGCREKILHSRYLITLDSDTSLGIGQAKRLIGILSHPFHRAKIKRGKKGVRIVSGNGILQPRINSSLLEKITTPFGKMIGNGSGEIFYSSASFDLMQSLYGEGNFCGKGIIDVAAYDQIVTGTFPREKILSHDMPEGALLRCSMATNEYLSDSNPQNAVSYYKRQHRWIRGDIQNLRIIFRLRPIRAFLYLENLLRYLVPVSELMLLVISSWLGSPEGVIASLVVLLLHFQSFLFGVFRFLLEGNSRAIVRRFSTRIRNVLLHSCYQSLFTLSAIPFEAYYYSDAIIRSLYRMGVSKRKLLQWQIYSPYDAVKHPFFFFSPALLLGLFILFTANHEILISLGLIWCFFPLFCYYLSRPYPAYEGWSAQEMEEMLEMLKCEWRFFHDFVSEKTQYLPPDNIQFDPETIAMRTSPTNIGLYLVSLTVAYDFELIGKREFLTRLKGAVETIQGLEKHAGHLYNWYDLNHLAVLGDRYVSTVDSGNFIASLMTVSSALREYEEKDPVFGVIRCELDKLIRSCNFSILFDFDLALFYVGIRPDGKKDDAHYDLYMSENRITSFLAISQGQIPVHHWYRLGRPLVSEYGRVGLASWSGTTFEYFMPALFLPVIENSLEDESLEFAYECQEKYDQNVDGKMQVFGISESGFSQTDAAGNYQYKAFGVPSLSMQEGRLFHKVISPYSSFLMLERGRERVLENLKNLKSIGLVGPYGYWEACEFNSCFLGDFTPVYSCMSHHKGMSMLALANVLKFGICQRRFLQYGNHAAKAELLSERFPLEGKVVRQRTLPQWERKTKEKPPANNTRSVARILSDGKNSAIFGRDGSFVWYGKNIKILSSIFAENGVTLNIKDKEYPLFRQMIDGSVRYHSDFAEISQSQDWGSVKMKITPLRGKRAIIISFSLFGFREQGKIKIPIQLTMQDSSVYEAHPSFEDLSLEAKKSENGYLIRKRGVESHRYLRIKSSEKITLLGQHVAFCDSYRMTGGSNLFLEVNFQSYGAIDFSVLLQESEREQMEDLFPIFNAMGELKKEEYRLRDYHVNEKWHDNVCQSVEERLIQELFFEDRPLIWCDAYPVDRDFLWKHGISGDEDIVLFSLSETTDLIDVFRFFTIAKRFHYAGVKADFVLLQEEENGYFQKKRDEISDVIEELDVSFLIGRKSGIHIIPVEDNACREAFYRLARCCYFENSKALISQKEEPFAAIKRLDGAKTEYDAKIGSMSFEWEIDPRLDFPMSHVVANHNGGFVCNQFSLGFTWYRNAALMRISKWNSVPNQTDGEKIYLRRDGVLYDLVMQSERLQYVDNFAIYQGNVQEKPYQLIVTMSTELSAKMICVLLDERQEGDEILFSFVPCLGKDHKSNVLIRQKDGALVFSSALTREIPFFAYFFSSSSYRECYQSQNRVVIAMPVQDENAIYLGGFTSKKEWERVLFLLKEVAAEDHLKTERARFLHRKPKNFTDELSSWLYYQAVWSRFVGRTGLYQSSGAFGFRDQLQDALIFLEHEPELLRRHLIRCAAHQFEDGRVLHWWHVNRRMGNRDCGVITSCSDDYLWLCIVACLYMKKTDDVSLLDVIVPYLKPIEKNQTEEIYFSPVFSNRGTFREHLYAAFDLFYSRSLGCNGLPPMGSGDWNDGMNQVYGESAWLGFFGGIAIGLMMPYLDEDRRKKAKEFLLKLKDGLVRAYNGAWFIRAYENDGSKLGNDVSMESECSIDLITQAFAAFYSLVFYGSEFSLSDDFTSSALDSAWENLVDEKTRTVALFQKPFVSRTPSVGYIQKYCAGVRENGGQYTHAAVWFALALLLYGKKTGSDKMIERALKINDLIDPTKNLNSEKLSRYRREPYVLCGDVYTADGFAGQGGWSWYTGAAAWYYRLRKEIDKLKKEKE